MNPQSSFSTLVVGATGLVGRQVAAVLADLATPARPRKLRLLRRSTRGTSDAKAESAWTSARAELVPGDLKDPASLRAACEGIAAVVSTATAIASAEPGDSIESVDLRGQLALIDAAEAAGVDHFVFVSFPPVAEPFPLQDAKRAVEDRLRASRMAYTVLQCPMFMEVWLDPRLGFDYRQGKVRLYGEGDQPSAFVSATDVAAATAAAVDLPAARNRIIRVAGPEAITPNEIVAIFEAATGRRFAVDRVPISALSREYTNTVDDRQKSFFALTLAYARGDYRQTSDAATPAPARISVQRYAATVTARP